MYFEVSNEEWPTGTIQIKLNVRCDERGFSWLFVYAIKNLSQIGLACNIRYYPGAIYLNNVAEDHDHYDDWLR